MNQCADPNKEVRYACPVLYDGKYHGAAHGSAIVHAVIYHSGDPHRRLPEHGAGPDLCHGLKERIGFKSGLKRACRARSVQRWDLMYGSTIPLDTVSCSEVFSITWLMLLSASRRTHSYREGCCCGFHRRPSECGACLDLFQD